MDTLNGWMVKLVGGQVSWTNVLSIDRSLNSYLHVQKERCFTFDNSRVLIQRKHAALDAVFHLEKKQKNIVDHEEKMTMTMTTTKSTMITMNELDADNVNIGNKDDFMYSSQLQRSLQNT